ncbi:MAG: membrane protein insertase YidC [Hyphomonadaceae bacterium]
MQNPGGPAPDEVRNVIIAIVLSAAIMLGFEVFYNGPQRARILQERAQAEEQLRAAEAQAPAGETGGESQTPPASSGPIARDQALTRGGRVAIDTDAIDGSISLQGARIDDLNLRRYRETIDPQSDEVTLLSPIDTQYGHDAFFGWELQGGGQVSTLADAFSNWTAEQSARLTQNQSVTLTLNTSDGLTITRTIAVDDSFMFTITDVVRNASGADVQVRPFGAVRRQGLPEHYRRSAIVHQGLIGAFGPENHLHQVNFSNADKHARQRARGRIGEDERLEDLQGQGGWFGITEHYWLTALVPDQNERVSTYFDSRQENNVNDYRAAYRGQWRDLPAGGEVSYTQRLFAGAKRYEILRDYQNGDAARSQAPIPRFDDAIDWGNFWFLTRPFFLWLLHPLAQFFAGLGVSFNFALAILATTVVIKALMFPLVYQSFSSMAKMRGLAPKMKEIQERYAADKQRQQQEILKLYQTEKVNPVAGCLPMLLQIPVFFALYKTFSVTIEMRHAPFVGWIHDLSAPDPTSIFNLFGLLPAIGLDFHALPLVGALPAIGVWPIIYGLSMWALQALSPPPTDPTQAQIFRLMPILFTFMFATFPAGLVIYWCWSNTLSILQQYVIMRRQGVETQLDKFLATRMKRDPTAAE